MEPIFKDPPSVNPSPDVWNRIQSKLSYRRKVMRSVLLLVIVVSGLFWSLQKPAVPDSEVQEIVLEYFNTWNELEETNFESTIQDTSSLWESIWFEETSLN